MNTYLLTLRNRDRRIAKLQAASDQFPGGSDEWNGEALEVRLPARDECDLVARLADAGITIGYGDSPEITVWAEVWARNAVGPCQSSLVDRLLQLEEITPDDLSNTLPSEGSPRDMIEWLEDCEPDAAAALLRDWREELRDYGDLPESILPTTLLAAFLAFDDLDRATEVLVSVVQEHEEPREAMEWWWIDPSLADDLDEIGETVIRSEYGQWWGRQCSGQGIAQDSTPYRLMALYGKRTEPVEVPA